MKNSITKISNSLEFNSFVKEIKNRILKTQYEALKKVNKELKMNFYLSILNDTVKLEDENPSIGIIICKEKNRTIVEYALKGNTQPMGVSTYQTSKILPKNLEQYLPNREEIEKSLMNFLEEKYEK